MGVGVTGLQLDGLREAANGVCDLALRVERDAEVVVRLRERRIGLDRVAILGHGRVQPTLRLQDIAEPEVGFRMSGFQRDGLAVASGGLVRLALCQACRPERRQEARIAPVALHGARQVCGRGVEIPRLLRQRAHQIERIGVARLTLQDLPVDPLGGDEIAGLMVAESTVQLCAKVVHGESLCRNRPGLPRWAARSKLIGTEAAVRLRFLV